MAITRDFGWFIIGVLALPVLLLVLIACIGRSVAHRPGVAFRWRWLYRPSAGHLRSVFLIASMACLCRWPGSASLVAFGFASGWINLLIWAWLGRATDHPRTFGAATMPTKVAMLSSIPIAASQ